MPRGDQDDPSPLEGATALEDATLEASLRPAKNFIFTAPEGKINANTSQLGPLPRIS